MNLKTSTEASKIEMAIKRRPIEGQAKSLQIHNDGRMEDDKNQNIEMRFFKKK